MACISISRYICMREYQRKNGVCMYIIDILLHT